MDTVEDPANPLGEIVSTEQPLGLDHFAFAVNPLGLNRIEPPFATTLTEIGVRSSTAQKMLGHSDIRMPLAIYTRATDGTQDCATVALEETNSRSGC
jgi:hypothetical protein